MEQVDLHNGQLGFIISVPQSLTGPHQAPDKKYYKRFALEVRAMEDYEVRDVMARATSPYLLPLLTFDGREVTTYRFGAPIPISPTESRSMWCYAISRRHRPNMSAFQLGSTHRLS